MTKWKDEIDRALGQDVKFSEELHQKILMKATKRTFHWRYAFTAVALVMVALLLFLTGPTQEQEIKAATPFEQLIEQSQVEAFFISSTQTQETQFFARNSSRYMHVHAFKQEQDVREMQDFLYDMRLVETSMEYWRANDVLVEMVNGEQLKLKIVQQPGRYLVQDVYSKLVYEVLYSDSRAYENWLEKIDRSTLGIGGILGVFVLIILLAIGVDRLVKTPKKEQPRKRNWKSITVSIATVIALNVYINYLQAKEYVMHIDVHFVAIALLIMTTQFMEQKQSKSLKNRLIQWFGIAVILVFIWILLNFG